MIVRKATTARAVADIYDTCNRLFDRTDCFYTKQEVEKKLQEKNNKKIGDQKNV